MKYYSLHNPAYIVDFKDAVLMGQAPDRGLFFPVEIPGPDKDFWRSWKDMNQQELGFQVIRPFVGESIPEDHLREIVDETVDFLFPLVQITRRIFTLELFHGPTAAFKDVGARFMSRCLRYFARESSEDVTILVATSGDTGGAVADAFYDIDGVEVIILFPSKKVSKLQELQLTTYGKNISALEIAGTFDDCQAMVKEAFADAELQDHYTFSSANSINVARWLSQQMYYFYALRQWPYETPPVISVPSGNFGNICAGLMAYKRGLPVDSFIAACNENDVFTKYINSGTFQAQPAVATVSNAMDVGNPSNFSRVLQVFDADFLKLKDLVKSYSFSSEDTLAAIEEVYRSYGYQLDPHGAVGYLALQRSLDEHPDKAGIFLETAHPAKFADVVEPVFGKDLTLPEGADGLFKKKQHSIHLPADYGTLKEFLLERAGKNWIS